MVDDAPQVLPNPAPGFILGISVSDSPDLLRLGLTQTHLRMALGEVVRATLVASGRVSYGGHLGDDGFTAFLVDECERYGSRDRPFVATVPWSVHRRLTTDQIGEHRKALGLLGTYVFLDRHGEPMDDPTADRGPDGDELDPEEVAESLTSARGRLVATCDARVVVGGRRRGFEGRMPGIVEETILSIRADQPVFVAGGFGGAAGDVARTLGLDPENWLGMPEEMGRPDLAELLNAVRDTGWTPDLNGLSAEQNQQLAVSYRASEIASFVVHGMTQMRPQ